LRETTMSAIQLQQQINRLRRQLRENDFRFEMLLVERRALETELAAAAVRYQDALGAERLREQAAGAVAAVEAWLAGE
jgi:hypothetical protein